MSRKRGFEKGRINRNNGTPPEVLGGGGNEVVYLSNGTNGNMTMGPGVAGFLRFAAEVMSKDRTTVVASR